MQLISTRLHCTPLDTHHQQTHFNQSGTTYMSIPPPSPSSSQPSVLDALSTISPLSDLKALPNVPCARYSLLFGILAGASVGSIRFIFARRVISSLPSRWGPGEQAANWAVGAWAIASLGAWETCTRRQKGEAAKMAAIVAEIKAKRAARISSSPDHKEKRIGGILMGAKAHELLEEKSKDNLKEKDATDSKSWWRSWL